MKNFKLTLIGMLVMMMFAVPASAEKAADKMDKMGHQGSIRASELMDMKVHDQQGNEIGNVSDLVVSREGEVAFLILSKGGTFLGVGTENLMPIPWDTVQAGQFNAEDKVISLALDEQALRGAPSFNDDQWAAFGRGEMDQDVRGYYDTRGQQKMDGTRKQQKMDKDRDAADPQKKSKQQ